MGSIHSFGIFSFDQKYQTVASKKFMEGQIISVNHLHLLSFIIVTIIVLLSFLAIQLLISDHLAVTEPSPVEDFPLSKFVINYSYLSVLTVCLSV